LASPFRRLLRADLHIHTRHSLLGTLPVLAARDCYSDPEAAYETAKLRGMDLVTFTDHDTIGGCLELLSSRPDLPDFFISEEVSTRDPVSGCRLHVSVFGIDEERHREIQRLRGNIRELMVYLDRESIPAALNHLGSSLVRRRPDLATLVDLISEFRLIETLNGAQQGASNAAVAAVADFLESRGKRLGRTGGSDAHTLARIGTSWTEAQAADRESFLLSLHAAEAGPGGVSSSLSSVVLDVYRIVLGYYGDIVGNRNGHFEGRSRRRAVLCALASLPLHLSALPVTGTLYRSLRVRRATLGLTREIALQVAGRGTEANWEMGAELPRPFAGAGLAAGAADCWVAPRGMDEL
jgi:predicted metal-dependent phosphoesterase TrpH